MLTLLVHPSIRPSASVDERQSLQARRVVVTVRCAAWYFGYPRARIKSFDVSVMLGLRPSSRIKRLLRFTLKRFVDYIQHNTRKEKKREKMIEQRTFREKMKSLIFQPLQLFFSSFLLSEVYGEEE